MDNTVDSSILSSGTNFTKQKERRDEMKKLKFAVIGMGFIYPRHKQAIEKLGHEILLTCDSDPRKLPDFLDWIEMFNHPKFNEVDAVVICTPNYLHSTIAREALLRNKRVLSEKPLSINGTDGLWGVNTVLQLRKHPKLQNLHPNEVFIEAKMFRDESYWSGWKGNEVKSGGILYNLGIHYVDLAVFLLGSDWKILNATADKKKVVADVDFNGKKAHIHIEIVDRKEDQGRKLIADGEEITLSNQENLSYEDLHIEVYKDFIEGNGIPLSEAEKSLELVSRILTEAQ